MTAREPSMRHFVTSPRKPVYAIGGEQIGAVEEIYYDESTEQPQWIKVRGTGVASGFVVLPAGTAQFRDGAVHVPYPITQALQSPAVKADGRISKEEEGQLCAYYGLPQKEPDEAASSRSVGVASPATSEKGDGAGGTGSHSVTRTEQSNTSTQRPPASAVAQAGEKSEAPTEADNQSGDGQKPGLKAQMGRLKQEAMVAGQEALDVARDIGSLIQKEAQLAKLELAQQVKLSAAAMAWGGAAGVLAFLMLAFLSLSVMFVLSLFLPIWAGALITAGILGVFAAAAGFIAMRQFRRIRPIPERTVASIKEDIQWVRNNLKSNGS